MAFFQRFAVVLNALDNLPARRHVNRMCMAAGVPLVDSGTTGFLGQVRGTRRKGVGPCFVVPASTLRTVVAASESGKQ